MVSLQRGGGETHVYALERTRVQCQQKLCVSRVYIKDFNIFYKSTLNFFNNS